MSNGSFTDGSEGWTLHQDWELSSAVARTGPNSLRLGASHGADLRKRLLVYPGLLTIRFWYYVPVSAPDRGFVTLTIALHDASGSRIGLLFHRLMSLAVAHGEWQQMSLLEDITAEYRGRSVASIELMVGVAGVGLPASEVHIDDFEAYQETFPVGPQLLPNPGFEEIDGGRPANWTHVTGPVSTSTAVVLSGERSVYLDDPSTTSAVALRSAHVVVSSGSRYVAGVAVYNVSGSSSYLYLEYWDGAGERVAAIAKSAFDIGVWTSISCAAEAPPTAETATVLLYRDSTGTGASDFR